MSAPAQTHAGWTTTVTWTTADGSVRGETALRTDDRHPAGTHVDGGMLDHDPGPLGPTAADPSVDLSVLFSLPGGHRRAERVDARHRLHGGRWHAAPPLVHVVHGEPDASPPACALAAHVVQACLPGGTSEQAPSDGTYLSPAQASRLGLSSSTLVATVRWLPGSGVVHVVTVAPSWRRRRVAMKLLAAAQGLALAHGWPTLRDSGEHTQDGDALVDALPAHYSSTLTPAGSRVGFPAFEGIPRLPG